MRPSTLGQRPDASDRGPASVAAKNSAIPPVRPSLFMTGLHIPINRRAYLRAAPHGIFPKRGAAIATNKKCTSRQWTVFHPELDQDFLFQWFQTFDLRAITEPGPTPQLNKKDIEPLILPVPPNLQERREMVAIPDAIDRKIEPHRKKRAVLDALFRAMLRKMSHKLRARSESPISSSGRSLWLPWRKLRDERAEDQGTPSRRVVGGGTLRTPSACNISGQRWLQREDQMSVTIDLPPDVEARLAAQAAEVGVPLVQHLRRLLEEHAGASNPTRKTPAERAKHWRESVAGLPDTKPLSDEAISRESIYAERG